MRNRQARHLLRNDDLRMISPELPMMGAGKGNRTLRLA